MPAPLDWSAAGGRQAVLVLAAAVGSREASRRLGLSPTHAAALRQMDARAKRRLSPANVTTQSAPVTALQAVSPSESTRVSPTVTTACQAVAESIAEHGAASLAAGAKVVRQGLEHLAGQSPAAIVKQSRAAKELIGARAILHGGAESGQVRINIYAGTVTQPEKLVEGRVIDPPPEEDTASA